MFYLSVACIYLDLMCSGVMEHVMFCFVFILLTPSSPCSFFFRSFKTNCGKFWVYNCSDYNFVYESDLQKCSKEFSEAEYRRNPSISGISDVPGVN